MYETKTGIPVVAILMLAGACLPAAAANKAPAAAQAVARTLHALGLFTGTGTGADGAPKFDLDRAPTRQEAVTMLVRLLGKEAEAIAYCVSRMPVRAIM